MSEFWLSDPVRLKHIIADTAFALEPHVQGICHPKYLLGAIATVESSFGERNILRHEPAYMPSGRYYELSQDVRDRWKRWGIMSACSFSSFQILYTTACELGFDHKPWDRHPLELYDDRIAIQYVVKYLIKRVISKTPECSLEKIFDAYNSGSARDSIVPTEYILKATRAYDNLLANKAF